MLLQVSTTGGLAGLALENTMLDADIYLGSNMWGVDYYRGCKLVVRKGDLSKTGWLYYGPAALCGSRGVCICIVALFCTHSPGRALLCFARSTSCSRCGAAILRS